jgi:hypothetical protein
MGQFGGRPQTAGDFLGLPKDASDHGLESKLLSAGKDDYDRILRSRIVDRNELCMLIQDLEAQSHYGMSEDTKRGTLLWVAGTAAVDGIARQEAVHAHVGIVNQRTYDQGVKAGMGARLKGLLKSSNKGSEEEQM